MHPPFLLKLLACDLIQALVSCVEDQISANHQQVQDVENQNIPLGGKVGHVGLVQELTGDAGDVTEEDEAQEGKALTLGGSGLVGLDNIHRPGHTEANDHNDFQDFRHLKFLLIYFYNATI